MQAYLDYNSTSPIDPQVYSAMERFFRDDFGNASSVHRKGQAARHAVEAAREAVADVLDAEPSDVFFTSGGTEADNIALRGVMEAVGSDRRHLVISAIEHPAVLECAAELGRRGYSVILAPVDARGIVDLKFLKGAITGETALVSVMHANNETGSIQPIREIAALADAKGALFHTDAVQSFTKIPLKPYEDGVDLASFSAHKICGPKGVGALFIRKGTKIKPLFYGGHQEKNIRPGTENVAMIAGFGQAVRQADVCRVEESSRVRSMRDRLWKGFCERLDGIHRNADDASSLYNTLNVSFSGLDGETLLMNFDLKNIWASTGSACTAGSVEVSHVLRAMGIEETLARASVRFSLGRFTTEDEIRYALDEIPSIVQRLRQSSSSQGTTSR